MFSFLILPPISEISHSFIFLRIHLMDQLVKMIAMSHSIRKYFKNIYSKDTNESEFLVNFGIVFTK